MEHLKTGSLQDNMQPKVSIIVPAYNVEKVISECLQSLLAQTYANIEIICVNDGSIDRSPQILDHFAKTYPQIKVIHQANQGQCVASNAAIELAGGEYIKFFDADDIMNPEHIELQVQRMNNRTDALCSCEWGRFYNDDVDSVRFIPESVWHDMKPIDWVKSALKQKSDMMGAWLWLIPKVLIDEAGGWDERLSYCPNNDFEFSIRLLLHAKDVLFTKGAKVFYRTGNSNSLSANTSKAAYESILLATDLGCELLLKRENSAEMRRLCANRYQNWLYTIYPKHPDLIKRLEK
ncbi:MAG: glycosyl transferase family 2, partial [Segetibacter sp.]|nr:glycosyl transferase family 2 [Segetibacter sp.]